MSGDLQFEPDEIRHLLAITWANVMDRGSVQLPAIRGQWHYPTNVEMQPILAKLCAAVGQLEAK